MIITLQGTAKDLEYLKTPQRIWQGSLSDIDCGHISLYRIVARNFTCSGTYRGRLQCDISIEKHIKDALGEPTWVPISDAKTGEPILNCALGDLSRFEILGTRRDFPP